MIENRIRNSDGSYRASALELMNKLANVFDQALDEYGDQLTLDGVAMISHSVISERLALKVALESDEVDSWKKEYEIMPQSQLPALVLGIRNQDGTQKYVFKQQYNDYKLCHRTDAKKIYIQGLVLTPYPDVLAWMENMRNTFRFDDDKHMINVRRYQDDYLSKKMLTCNNCYPLLREGVYPVDVSDESLATLTPDHQRLPSDLDELIDWGKSSNVQRMRMSQRWDVFIMA